MISAFRLAGFELRRFKGPLPILALVFVLLVPLLYGALYLWSTWDPYGRLDKVPVAVVNQDQAVSVDGRTVDAGDQFVAELQNNPIFDWNFVEEGEAEQGLAQGRYYLVITVPADFSGNLASGPGIDPQRAVLQLHRDDANGYVIGTLADSVKDRLTAAIDKAAIGAYFDAVFTNLQNIRSDVTAAADAAGQLSSGAGTAVTGASDLANGLVSAQDGATQLLTGLTDAQSAATQLSSGTTTAQQGSASLSSGVAEAQSGAEQLSSGLGTLQSGSSELVSGADQVAAGTAQLAGTVVPVLDTVDAVIPQVDAADAAFANLIDADSGQVTGRLAELAELAQELPDSPTKAALIDALNGTNADVADAANAVNAVVGTLNADGSAVSGGLATASSEITQLADAAAQVADGAAQLDSGVASAVSSAGELAAGLSTASSGAQSLDSGLLGLVDGATQLDQGLVTLQSGAQTLSDGVGSAQTGAGSVTDGITQLQSGATQLADQLTQGAGRIPALTEDQSTSAAQVLSEPVDVQTTVDNAAVYYGRGLAPFFFAIALWVFGITAFLVLRPISGRALIGRASAARLAMAGWLPVAAVGAVGALILLGVCWWALGLDPVNVGPTFLVIVLAAVCFTAIAHLLRTALGVVGSALTLVLLMIQLTSCAGIYPAETLPAPLRAIHPLMPMTYLVDALRVAFTGGLADHLWRDVAVLAGFAVLALLITVLVVSRRKRLTLRDLHPALG